MDTAIFSTEPSYAFRQSYVENVQGDPFKTVPSYKTPRWKLACLSSDMVKDSTYPNGFQTFWMWGLLNFKKKI